MPFNDEQHLQQLEDLYKQAFLEVLEVLLSKEKKHQNTVFHKDQLKQIMSILQELDNESARWIEKVIPQAYQANYNEVLAFVQKMAMQRDIKPAWAKVHQTAIDILAQNLQGNLRNAISYAGRRINDIYRQAQLEAAAAKVAGGKTVLDMKKDLIERLKAKGIDGFVDKAGRVWKLERYATMAARTVTRDIMSAATVNTCLENGIDLVYMPAHNGSCDMCLPWQGKVFSISGKTNDWPGLKVYPLTEENRPPIHPYCRHSIHPYIYELNEGFEE